MEFVNTQTGIRYYISTSKITYVRMKKQHDGTWAVAWSQSPTRNDQLSFESFETEREAREIYSKLCDAVQANDSASGQTIEVFREIAKQLDGLTVEIYNLDHEIKNLTDRMRVANVREEERGY